MIRAASLVSSQVMRASGSDMLMARDGRRCFGASLMVWSFCNVGSVPTIAHRAVEKDVWQGIYNDLR